MPLKKELKLQKKQKEIENKLFDLLVSCLDSENQYGMFRITNLDLDSMKMTVEFDIVEYEGDYCFNV